MKLLLPLLAILSAAGADVPANSELLRHTAKSVERFWDELQAVNCLETVDQQKLNPNGKIDVPPADRFRLHRDPPTDGQ